MSILASSYTIAYIRVSTRQQHESAASQRRVLLAYALQNGFMIDEFIVDEKSGLNENREGYQHMLELIHAGKVTRIVTWQLNRLSRNAADGTALLELLRQKNIELLSVMEAGFGNDPAGDLLRKVMIAYGEFYSRALAIDVKRGMKAAAEQGRWVGGVPPYGYKVDQDHHLQLMPEQAQVVKLIFAWYAAGKTMAFIQKELNLLGYKSACGDTFSKASIREILHAEVYTGSGAWNKRAEKVDGRGNSHAQKDKNSWIPFTCPPIISQDVWEAAQTKLLQNHSGKSRAKHAYPLSGIGAKCAACGAALTGEMHKIGKGKFARAYFCSGRRNRPESCTTKALRADALEAAVCTGLTRLFTPTIMLQALTAAVNTLAAKHRHDDGRLERLQHTLSQNAKEIDALLSAVKDGVRSTPVLQALEDASKRRDEIAEAIVQERVSLESPVYTQDDIANALEKLPLLLQDLSRVGESRTMLSHYVSAVTVTNKGVDIAIKTPVDATAAKVGND